MFQEFKGLNAPNAPETNISCCMTMPRETGQDPGTSVSSGDLLDRTYPDRRSMHLALLLPSHLEAVNPVVQGKARAKMHYKGDSTGHTVMPVMLHGDAAYAGQGVVYETACMSNLKNYHAGGTVHIVVNNQIGFTTDPECSRSTKYCTALATAYGAPIFHVNADDVDAVVRVFNLAVEWRQTWHTDVMIDLIGYRRFGHNEIDEPMFTQPLMYEQIKNQRKTLDLYRDELIASGVHDEASAKATDAVVAKALDDAWEASDTYDAVAETNHQWLDSRWKGFFDPNAVSPPMATGASEEHLAAAVEVLSSKPECFNMHQSLYQPKKDNNPQKINGLWNNRSEALRAGVDLDWACAEQLAFGTLMQEGTHVRLSGQDVQRGTFSHRHAVFHDQKNGEKFVPLDALEEKGAASFHPCNSPLSEFGVLGFELGYSLENPNALVMWEAQFGDFVNGAQIIIDQFISSGEEKWHRQSALCDASP